MGGIIGSKPLPAQAAGPHRAVLGPQIPQSEPLGAILTLAPTPIPNLHRGGPEAAVGPHL